MVRHFNKQCFLILASTLFAPMVAFANTTIVIEQPIELGAYSDFFETWGLRLYVDSTQPNVESDSTFKTGCQVTLEYPEKIFPAGEYVAQPDLITAPNLMSSNWKRSIIYTPPGYYDENNPNPPKRVVIDIFCERGSVPVTNNFINSLFKKIEIQVK